MKRRFLPAGLFVAFLSTGTTSLLAHDYTAGTMGHLVAGSPVPLSFTDSESFDNGPAGSGLRAGVAAAGPGLANTVGDVLMTTNEEYTYSGGIASTFVESDARYTLQHIVLSGPAGTPPGTIIGYTVNYALTSEFSASHSGPGDLYSSASGVITWNTDSSLGSAGGELGHRLVKGDGASEATGIFSATGASTTWMARAGDQINVNFNLHTTRERATFAPTTGRAARTCRRKPACNLR